MDTCKADHNGTMSQLKGCKVGNAWPDRQTNRGSWALGGVTYIAIRHSIARKLAMRLITSLGDVAIRDPDESQ